MRLYFEIWYVNGYSIRGQTLEDWLKMPDEGILVITEVYDRYYGHPRKYCGKRHAYTDYYWMNENNEIDCGAAKNIPDNVFIKHGKYVDNETWDRIYNLACIDKVVE